MSSPVKNPLDIISVVMKPVCDASGGTSAAERTIPASALLWPRAPETNTSKSALKALFLKGDL